MISRPVHLHRNLNQKQPIFAFQIAPATAVKLLDSIAPSRVNKGQFLHAKLGQFQMQINRYVMERKSSVQEMNVSDRSSKSCFIASPVNNQVNQFGYSA